MSDEDTRAKQEETVDEMMEDKDAKDKKGDEPVLRQGPALPDIAPMKQEEEVDEITIKSKSPEGEKKKESDSLRGDKKEDPLIFAIRTTANREDQVMDFVSSNVTKKGVEVYSIVRPHGMRGYIFIEAATRIDAEQAVHGIPYARGLLAKEIDYSEMEHMIEPVKRELTIKKNDIVEIISGPFKRETAKITRIDEQKEEVVVELVEAAVPIPITLKIDAVKVIRRETED